MQVQIKFSSIAINLHFSLTPPPIIPAYLLVWGLRRVVPYSQKPYLGFGNGISQIWRRKKRVRGWIGKEKKK